MSDPTTPMGAEPPDPPDVPDGPGGSASGSGWSSGRKALAAGAVVVLVLLAAGGGALLASSGDGDDTAVRTDGTSTSTTREQSVTTTSTTVVGAATPGNTSFTPNGGGTAAPATTTTKPTQLAPPPQPGITLPDEPTFTSVSVPASFQCPPSGPGQVAVSWTTQNATSVVIHSSVPATHTGLSPSGTVKILVLCSSATTLNVQFSASGPGGSAVAVRNMAITH